MGFRTRSMESCSSGEDLAVKARKPYTITKQRERWTEEEHNRFLEALKLYGRAWQRIEEHIGTKTAIQIRSHAQKFFTKLEKEALTKGIPPGQTLEIEIPPPRPKRKPSNPYPRKTGATANSPIKEEKQDKLLAASHSSSPNAEALDAGDDDLAVKLTRTDTPEKETEACEIGACTEVLPLFNDGPLTSLGSKKCTRNAVVFREFAPLPQKDEGKSAMNKLATASEKNKQLEHCTSDAGNVNVCRLEEFCINSQPKTAQLEMLNKNRQHEEVDKPSISDLEHGENGPKYVPVHHVRMTSKGGEPSPVDPKNTISATHQLLPQINTNTFRNSSISTGFEQQTDSSMPVLHPIQGFPPFCLTHNHEAYRSFFDASSTFSNLVFSTLVQNPAAHSAATFAASCLPLPDSVRAENSTRETPNETISGHISPHPSMAATAAATVAAATAWWAMHGLLPLCHPPFPAGFSFFSATTTTSPIVITNQVEEKHERRGDTFCVRPDPEKSMPNSESPEHLILRRSVSKSAPSTDSDESRELVRSDGTNLRSSGIDKLTSTLEAKSKGRRRKRKEDCCRDGSKHSCIEHTDTVETSHPNKKKPEPLDGHASVVKVSFAQHQGSEIRVTDSRNEGRLAFQALFSREELPQSFSPPPTEDCTTEQCTDIGATTPSVDLNNSARAFTREHDHVSGSGEPHLRNTGGLDKSTCPCEGEYSNPRARRMGFKPYKRCSMEANVNRVNSEEEKGGKRLQMEAKTSNL